MDTIIIENCTAHSNGAGIFVSDVANIVINNVAVYRATTLDERFADFKVRLEAALEKRRHILEQ